MIGRIISERFYTPKEIAEYLVVSKRTIEREIAKGNLIAVRISPHKVKGEYLKQYLAENSNILKEEMLELLDN